jgi:hypothetical protein
MKWNNLQSIPPLIAESIKDCPGAFRLPVIRLSKRARSRIFIIGGVSIRRLLVVHIVRGVSGLKLQDAARAIQHNQTDDKANHQVWIT